MDICPRITRTIRGFWVRSVIDIPILINPSHTEEANISNCPPGQTWYVLDNHVAFLSIGENSFILPLDIRIIRSMIITEMRLHDKTNS